jgi:ankyrin repeat protein
MIIQTFLSLIKINIDDYTISGERKLNSRKQSKIKKIRGIVEPDSDENITKFIRGNLDTMIEMMESGNITNVDVQDKTTKYTALRVKTFYGDIADMEWLLKKKANVDLQGSDGMSAIFDAIDSDFNDFEKVELLLEYKPNLNIISNSGDTPLTYAIKSKKNKIISILEKSNEII